MFQNINQLIERDFISNTVPPKSLNENFLRTGNTGCYRFNIDLNFDTDHTTTTESKLKWCDHLCTSICRTWSNLDKVHLGHRTFWKFDIFLKHIKGHGMIWKKWYCHNLSWNGILNLICKWSKNVIGHQGCLRALFSWPKHFLILG